MGLLSRLTEPLPGEAKIPVHTFNAAIAEVKRGIITLTNVGDAFNLSAGERTELASYLANVYVDGVSREVMHDVLMLGEEGHYTQQQCADRLLNVPVVTDIWSLITARAFDIVAASINGNCVLTNCAVSAQNTPDMTLAVAKGSVITNQVLRPVTAANVTITAAHATLPRIDMVVIDATGAKVVRAGTPATKPLPPGLTAGDVALSFVYVRPAATVISNENLLNTRVVRTVGPITIGKITTPVVRNNTAVAQAFVSFVIPAGLFLAGRVIRVSMGGTMLFNSGTPTLTMRIAYGGTTMFQDVTGVATADTDRLAWSLDFNLTAQADNDQNLNGTLQLGALGAKTAPNTGTGDIAANGLSGVFNGAAAVDSDAADRTLLVEFTMNVANASNEIAMEFATGELL
jgi:hypothetical protein